MWLTIQQKFQYYWQRLIQPSVAVKGEQQQSDARLVAGLSLVLFCVGFFVVILWRVAIPGYLAAPYISAAILASLGANYWLARGPRYKLTPYALVSTIVVTVIVILLTAPGTKSDRMLALTFLNFAILLSSLLLSIRHTLVVSIFSLLATVYYAHIADISLPVTISYIVFMTIMAALLILVSRMRSNNIQQLQASHRRYQALFHQSNDAVFIIGLNGKHIEVNQSAADMLGYSLEETNQLSVRDVVAPAELELGAVVLSQLLNRERIPIYERTFRRKDGTEFPVEINAELVTDAAGKPLHIQSIVRDITSRKAAEHALRASEARFRHLTLQSPDTIYIYNLATHKVEFFNAEMFLGYSQEELEQPGSIVNQIHPDDMAKAVDYWQHLTATGESGPQIEYRLRHKAGHWEWVLNRAIVLSFTDDKKPAEILVVLTIVSERREFDERLRHKEEYLRILIEQTPIGIVTVDMDGRLKDANPRSLEILGASESTLNSSVNLLSVPNLIKLGISQMIEDAIVTGKETELETWYTSSWGKTVYLLLRAVPHFDGLGNQIGLIILVEDLTERVQAEAGMREMQKLDSLSVLAGGIAHDFNNLLVAMLGQTSLAQSKLRPESPGLPHVEKAVMAAKQASRLTQQLLAYSGRGHFQVVHLDLNSLLEENLHLFAATIPKRIHLRTNLAESLPLIEVDLAQMQQVVMNLIINAAEAMGDSRGTISIVTDVQTINHTEHKYWQYTMRPVDDGLFVTLEIHDDGEGMSQETLMKIFDPFFTTKEKGHGLGLAAVLGIIKGHRGGLTVYSELGKGTTFKILLPASSTPKVVNGEMPLSESGKSGGLVLVIDDEKFVRMAVVDILAFDNIEVISAADGKEGLAMYQERQDEIGLVLLDLSMPGWSGEQTMRELHKVNPAVPIILSSGYNEVEATRLFIGKGLVGFLQKPYSTKSLLETVRQYLK